ncbi:biotin synthase BioB [Verrucomicrobia bacterium S94]|nr:biotin synthase BioB [Verrucomicrobia bacterium S94]
MTFVVKFSALFEEVMIDQVKEKCISGTGCSADEALALVEWDENELLAAATEIRKAFFGNSIELCSIINAKSGRCDMDCRFCSQSAHNSTEIDVYPFMDSRTLEHQIREDIKDGNRKCGVVTSGGKLSTTELKELAGVVRKIGGGEKTAVCASLGRLTPEELAMLKASGVTRFHHNMETSENFYAEICTTQSWKQRLETVKAAQAAGLNVCSGGLFGMGERWEDRIDLAIALRELGVDSVPINFLYAHPGTPLKRQKPLSAAEALRIIAVYRFLLPDVTLRICGGRAHILGDRQSELFAAGANGLMTGNYLTVAGSQYESDLEMIERLNLAVEPV